MAKAGRKRKIGAREMNGRPQRTGRLPLEQENMRVAIEYRQRVFGISQKDVMDWKAATLLGRLCLRGSISHAQWQAGEDYRILLDAMSAAMMAPRGFKTLAGGEPLPEDEATRRYQATKRKFDAANAAIEGHAPVAERKDRLLAMRAFLVDEIDQPHMHGTLRTALNGLAKHFGHERQVAA